jgi:hypothetical protein
MTIGTRMMESTTMMVNSHNNNNGLSIHPLGHPYETTLSDVKRSATTVVSPPSTELCSNHLTCVESGGPDKVIEGGNTEEGDTTNLLTTGAIEDIFAFCVSESNTDSFQPVVQVIQSTKHIISSLSFWMELPT